MINSFVVLWKKFQNVLMISLCNILIQNLVDKLPNCFCDDVQAVDILSSLWEVFQYRQYLYASPCSSILTSRFVIVHVIKLVSIRFRLICCEYDTL